MKTLHIYRFFAWILFFPLQNPFSNEITVNTMSQEVAVVRCGK